MIHKYKQLGLNIVMDVYSGAVHVVDDVMYDMLDYTLEPFMAEAKCPDYIKEGLKDKYSEEELEESYAEICALVNAGQLFTDDCYDEIAKNWNKQSVVKALCIHVAHDCNLRCKYCFADTGEFHGGRSLMSAEVGKKAIDFVINNSGNRKNIEIDYFGGEPLMNFGVVKEITEYAKEEAKKHGKNFRFTVTTNGVLLNDDIKQYINENMSNVVLSIDGTKETNDRMRYRVDGSGSYDTIVPKFQDLAESRNQNNYYVRGTFTAYNVDFAKDVIHLADLGFKQTSVEPVVAPETEDYALTSEHIEKVCAEYDKLTAEQKKAVGDRQITDWLTAETAVAKATGLKEKYCFVSFVENPNYVSNFASQYKYLEMMQNLRPHYENGQIVLGGNQATVGSKANENKTKDVKVGFASGKLGDKTYVVMVMF
mgnify:CR=1 FL=1